MKTLPRYPTKLTQEFIQNVADVYLANLNGRPTKAVMEHFGVAHRTASNYVKAAELSGYLASTTPGSRRSGGAGEARCPACGQTL